MGRVPSSAITLASCLSARPTEDLGDPPHELTGSDDDHDRLRRGLSKRQMETRASIY